MSEDPVAPPSRSVPEGSRGRAGPRRGGPPPTAAQRAYLERGLAEPGGKLPLFDRQGREIARKTVESCLARGWCAPWFDNPTKPDWIVCRLTEDGRAALARASARERAGRVNGR